MRQPLPTRELPRRALHCRVLVGRVLHSRVLVGRVLHCRALLGVLVVSAVLAASCSDDEPGSTEPAPTSVVTSPSSTSSSSSPSSSSSSSASSSPAPTSTEPDSTVDTTSTLPSREWTLLAGGDVLLDRTESQGIDPFTLLDPPLDSGDLALVNVEMAISDRGLPVDKLFVFRAPLSAAARIASGGVDVASLANNHAKDYGPDALVDTVEWLEAAGVVSVGAGATVDDAYRHRVLTTENGVRVAFVGASLIVPPNFAASPTAPGIASAHPPNRSRVLDSVRAAADDADAVIATVHWGIERDTCPSPEQQVLAQELLAAGADAVIGHHPHVLQPVEFGDGTLVAYSLGNFVWHPRAEHTGETGVLQIDFDGSEVVGWSFHPHLLGPNGAPAPTASGARHDRIRDVIAGDCARHDPPPPSYATTITAPEDATGTTLPPPTGTAGIDG